ncbi:MAG TPA: choice-of-anchor L domain-containing protein [Actinokineospora sp.]|nr:choice-of-anchor L domain-containing protein [Actinokineospora sp.]
MTVFLVGTAAPGNAEGEHRPPPADTKVAEGSSAPASVAQAPAAADDGGSTVGVTPFRVLDTRIGTGRPGNTTAPVGTGQSIDLQIAGVGAVPAAATAVVLNVTAVAGAEATFVTVWPTGEARPTTSNLNVVAGQVSPNLVTVGLGGGKLSLYNNRGGTHLIADVFAYVVPQSGGGGGLLVDLPPQRLLDTRVGTGRPAPGAVGTGQTIPLDVTGIGGVPETGVSAVVLNVTATEPTASSYVTVFPTGASRPTSSNLNMVAGDTVPNRVIVPVGADGTISLFNFQGSTHLIADVGGFFTDDTQVETGSGLVRMSPTRLLDTRQSTKLVGGGSKRVQVAGVAGIPGVDAEVPPTAAIVNLTATNPTAGAYLTAWPAGLARPLASDLNVRAGETRPNLVVVKLGPTGAIDFFTNTGSVDIIVDVFAYYTGGLILNPDLEVLPSAAAGSVVAIDATTVSFHGTAAGLGIAVGQIIASGPVPNAPDGFLRKVTALTQNGDTLVVTAQPAAIQEAVPRGGYSGPINLVPLANSAQAQSGQSAAGVSTTITAPYNLSIEGFDADPNDNVVASAKLEGSLSLTAGLELTAKFGLTTGVHVDFESRLEATLLSKLEVTAAYEFLAKEIELYEQEFAGFVFFIGSLPVFVQPEFELGLAVEGSAKGALSVSLNKSQSVTTGFKMRNSDIDPYVNHSGAPASFTVNAPEASVELGAELQATLEAEFYGGFELGVGIAPGITATVNASTCELDIALQMKALAEFEVEMFGKEIGEGLEFSTELFKQSLLKKSLPQCANTGWTIDTGVAAGDLAAELAGPGVAIQSAAASGAGQVGRFTAPFESIKLDKGTVLSTGNAAGAPGPNNSSSYSGNTGGPGDGALSAIVGGTTYDTAALDIQFVPTTATVQFSFVFGSEEYLEYVDSGYNDVFGAFVNGQNCAVIDKGFERVPSTVNAINHKRNTLQFRDNTGGSVNAQADGLTTVLRCTASVTPNVPNTLRLAIADTGDRVYDSWAFIQRGSFRAV